MKRRYWTRHLQIALVVAMAMLGKASATASGRHPIDPEHSIVTVHVGKSGMFRAFADNHEIRVAVKGGFVDEDARAVEILIEARALRVIDPKLSPKDRAEVQTRMLGAEVLDVDRYPEIRFVSRTAEDTPEGWTIRGQLDLHGHTGSVTATVTREDGHYAGAVRLKQTEFGITPITVAAGAVAVKDEVTIDFDIVTRDPQTLQTRTAGVIEPAQRSPRRAQPSPDVRR